MANSYIEYTGDGSTTAYSIPFDFISSSHVTATVAGVATAITIAGTTATFAAAPASSSAIRISRSSSQTTRLVDYTQPSTLTEEDLDTDSKQAFFIAQEAVDQTADTIRKSASTLQWDALSKRLNNVADPTAAQDAATKNYIENTWLSASDKTSLTAVAGQSTEIGRLGTAATVADMAIIGTADFVSDINLVASADFVNDLNTVASADFVADLNVLATADVVSDMNTLGTSANVTAMDTVAGSITNVNTNATNIASINTNATNIASITGASTQATNAASSATASAASSAAAAASAASAAGNAGTQSVDRFNGNGSTTAFTMSASPATENNTSVYVSGVYQQKDTYSISGTTLTFSEAPPVGTATIEVMHMSTLPTGVSPTVAATNTTAAGGNASVTASGHALTFNIPRGDTGNTGATGPTGSAATIAAGSTTTGSPGSSASVANSGSSGAATFDFTIPRGDVGATGSQGTQGIQGIQGIQGDVGPAGSVSGMADGTAAAPSLAFSADTNTGLFRPAADTIAITTGGAERLRVGSTGQVGLGIDVGTLPAWVNHGVKISNGGGISITSPASTDNRYLFFGTGTSSADIQLAAIKNTGSDLSFLTNGAEKVRLTSAGNFGINTSAAAHKLHVVGDGALTGHASVGVNAVDASRALTVAGASDGSASSILVCFNSSLQSKFAVRDDGYTTVGGDLVATGNVTAYSMADSKNDVSTIENPLDLVKKLRGVSFKWKDRDEDQKTMGFLYEEVAEAVPELARSDEDGRGSVMYQNTVALLIEAVKTLSTKVNELEAKHG